MEVHFIDNAEEELRENICALIEYFIDEQISPKYAAQIMLRLLADQMVVVNQKPEVLQQVLSETTAYLAGEIVVSLHRTKEAEAEKEKLDG